jgi:hypothetical protein
MQQLRQSQGFGKEGMEIYPRNLKHHKEKGIAASAKT